MQSIRRVTFAFIAMMVIAQTAWASSILVRVGTTASGEGSYGNVGWSTLTAIVDAATGNQVTTVGDFLNAGQVDSFDALWISTGSINGSTNLSAAEIANIQAFIATGRKVVLFGENTAWPSWNANILSVVGGSMGGGVNGNLNTVLPHDLTVGVTTINIPAGAAAVGVGGTSLFSANVATLWGLGNVLTFLDSNFYQDSFIVNADNLRFTQNLADWLADSGQTAIPEPASLLLLGSALGAGALRRLRKRA